MDRVLPYLRHHLKIKIKIDLHVFVDYKAGLE